MIRLVVYREITVGALKFIRAASNLSISAIVPLEGALARKKPSGGRQFLTPLLV